MKMETSLILLIFSVTFGLTYGQEWSCSSAESCANFIRRQYNLTETTKNLNVTIDVCLNKQTEINRCISETVAQCNWQGIEPEYRRLKNERKAIKVKCYALCPSMLEITSCAETIAHVDYVQNRFDEYCSSYLESLECKKKTLLDEPCSFGDQVFELGFDDSHRRIFQYMCTSGCDNITEAWAVLDECTRNVDLSDDKNCSMYYQLEECISNHNTCPQIRQMVPYFSPIYGEFQSSCGKITTTEVLRAEVSNTSSSEGTESTTSGSAVHRCVRPLYLTLTTVTVCKAVECLIIDGISLAYTASLGVPETILKRLREDWANCSRTGNDIVEENTLATEARDKYSNADSTTPRIDEGLSSRKSTKPNILKQDSTDKATVTPVKTWTENPHSTRRMSNLTNGTYSTSRMSNLTNGAYSTRRMSNLTNGAYSTRLSTLSSTTTSATLAITEAPAETTDDKRKMAVVTTDEGVTRGTGKTGGQSNAQQTTSSVKMAMILTIIISILIT